MLFPEGVGPTIQLCFGVSAGHSVWHKIIAHKILKNSGGDISYLIVSFIVIVIVCVIFETNGNF